ncbi:hypothetical protein D3C85_1339040 [compost metagenome]
MMTATGMTTVGMIAGTTGAAKTGAGNNGAENKPAAKPSAIVIGNATMIGPCVTVTRTIAATIVARTCPGCI